MQGGEQTNMFWGTTYSGLMLHTKHIRKSTEGCSLNFLCLHINDAPRQHLSKNITHTYIVRTYVRS